MNPVPLTELRLRPRHHLSALWWLALLYRRPGVFQLDLEKLGRGQRFAATARMYLHGLPYVVVIAVLGRLLVFGAFGIALVHAPTDLGVGSLADRIASGIAFGIAVGIASTRTYYLVAHPFFVWPRPRGDRYALHPVAWDDLCGIPFPGLCRLLADYARFDRLARISHQGVSPG